MIEKDKIFRKINTVTHHLKARLVVFLLQQEVKFEK
jgi:hypothetical protein